jgi:hypothetical protein
MRLNVALLECNSVSRTDRLRMLMGYLSRRGHHRDLFKAYWYVLDDWSARKLRRQIHSRRLRQRHGRRSRR